MKYIGIIVICCLGHFIGYSNIAVLNGLKHEHAVLSGNTVSGEIEVKNVSDTPQKIVLYLQDLSIPCQKDVIFMEPGASKNSLGTWITIENNEVVLEPGEIRKIIYRIRFPENTDPKSYWSMVMVEGETPLSEQKLKNVVTVSSKVRYGVQIICNLNKDSTEALQIDEARYNRETGTIEITLSNPSLYIEKSLLSVELYDGSSELVASESSAKENVYPGSCKTISIPFKEPLAAGKYSCMIVMDNEAGLVGTSFDFTLK